MNESRGEANIQLPAIVLLPVTPKDGHLVSAREFLEAADVLRRSGNVAVCAANAAQSLECALKAYLYHCGIPDRELKGHAIRHNLNALWTKAAGLGLPLPTVPPLWCSTLSGLHAQFHLRYPSTHGRVFPNPEEMLLELGKVVAEVQRAVK